MASIYDWSLTASNNASADSGLTWAEGQAPSTVNNSARVMMQRVAEILADMGGALTAGGTANGLTVTANSGFTAYSNGIMIAFKAASDNTGAATLNVNGVGAKAIRKLGESGDIALEAGDILTGAVYVARYNSALNGGAGAWQLINARTVLPNIEYATKSANYTALLADSRTLFDFTATATLSLTAAATLGDGWWCIVKADGGDVTVDPNSTEQIDGATTKSVDDGTFAFILCDGSAFHTVGTGTLPTGTSGHVLGYLDGNNTWSGTQTYTGVITSNRTLGSSNKIHDWQQGYGVYSDNTGSVGSTRLWFDGPDDGEVIWGPRSGSSFWAYGRIRVNDFVINTASGDAFEVTASGAELHLGSYSGSGSGLTALNASNLSSGTVATARLDSTVWRDANPPSGSQVASALTGFAVNTLASSGTVYGSSSYLKLSGSTGTSSLTCTQFNSTGKFQEFFDNGGIAVGSIQRNGSSTIYNTSSDRRLKKNIADLRSSGAFIDALRPRSWVWDSDHRLDAGFVADELQEVAKNSVFGEKDAVDEEGRPVYQMADPSSPEMIANIVAEIQDLRKRVKSLEGK